MARTVTGSYTLRPTKYSSYRSSGTFSDWFSNTNAPSNWTNQMNVGTNIGDNSDSTYFNDNSVDTSTDAKNCIMELDVTAGTVPAYDYTITKVTFYWRNKTSASTNNTRIFRIWNTIWDRNENAGTPASLRDDGRFCNMGFNGSTSSTSTGSTSVTTRSAGYTALTNPTMAAGTSPDRMALCIQAYKSSHLTSFNSYQLYDVWYIVEYTYQEPTEVTSTIRTDAGTSVSGDATLATNATGSITEEEGNLVTLTATSAAGYVFDGWYSGGVKVASTPTYSFTMAAATTLYALSKKRQIYVGTAQVKAIYIGTTEIGDVYIGTTKVYSESELLPTATS